MTLLRGGWHRPSIKPGRICRVGLLAKVVLLAMFTWSLTGCGGHARVARSPSPLPSCGANATALHLVARNLTYSADCLTAPANTTFTVSFENKDSGVTHNFAVHAGYWHYSVASPWLFMGAYVVGPATTTYRVGPLPAGHYIFMCDVHHDQMTGHLDVASSGP